VLPHCQEPRAARRGGHPSQHVRLHRLRAQRNFTLSQTMSRAEFGTIAWSPAGPRAGSKARQPFLGIWKGAADVDPVPDTQRPGPMLQLLGGASVRPARTWATVQLVGQALKNKEELRVHRRDEYISRPFHSAQRTLLKVYSPLHRPSSPLHPDR